MPAKSKSQQHLFGMVRAYQEGNMKHAPAKIKEVANHISPQDAHDFAATNTKKLPKYVKKSSCTCGTCSECKPMKHDDTAEDKALIAKLVKPEALKENIKEAFVRGFLNAALITKQAFDINQLINENPKAALGIAGGLGGAGIGALAGGEKNRGKGALAGGLAGAGLGALAGSQDSVRDMLAHHLPYATDVKYDRSKQFQPAPTAETHPYTTGPLSVSGNIQDRLDALRVQQSSSTPAPVQQSSSAPAPVQQSSSAPTGSTGLDLGALRVPAASITGGIGVGFASAALQSGGGVPNHLTRNGPLPYLYNSATGTYTHHTPTFLEKLKGMFDRSKVNPMQPSERTSSGFERLFNVPQGTPGTRMSQFERLMQSPLTHPATHGAATTAAILALNKLISIGMLDENTANEVLKKQLAQNPGQ
jgi:hypothetical protein